MLWILVSVVAFVFVLASCCVVCYYWLAKRMNRCEESRIEDLKGDLAIVKAMRLMNDQIGVLNEAMVEIIPRVMRKKGGK